MGHVHTFPVDKSLTPKDAWVELCIFGRRITNTGTGESWYNMTCDGEECHNIEEDPDGSSIEGNA